MTRSDMCKITMTIKSALLITQSPSNTFSLLVQTLNGLNIVQINLFLRRLITVSMVVDQCRVDGCEV